MGVLWLKNMVVKLKWQALPISELTKESCAAAGVFHLEQFGQGNESLVALIARDDSRIYVNGEPLMGQLRILQHQDEILAGQQRYYYSAESQPQVSIYQMAEGGRRPKCGVCRGAIENGQAVVACPRCGRVFHQIPAAENLAAKECWTYREKCLCDHPTALSDDATWRPEQEACCA